MNGLLVKYLPFTVIAADGLYKRDVFSKSSIEEKGIAD